MYYTESLFQKYKNISEKDVKLRSFLQSLAYTFKEMMPAYKILI